MGAVMDFSVLVYWWLGGAIAAAWIASLKGENGAAFFFGGLLFGPLTLVATIGMPSTRGWPCNRCGQRVSLEAQVCPWCGNEPPHTPESKRESKNALRQRPRGPKDDPDDPGDPPVYEIP